jgi:hypothetical protein
LLTLGAQFRGSQNTKKGEAGILTVFELIRNIVQDSIVSLNNKQIILLNAAKRTVSIEFSPDPDIIIREEMSNNDFRNIIAIEVRILHNNKNHVL